MTICGCSGTTQTVSPFQSRGPFAESTFTAWIEAKRFGRIRSSSSLKDSLVRMVTELWIRKIWFRLGMVSASTSVFSFVQVHHEVWWMNGKFIPSFRKPSLHWGNGGTYDTLHFLCFTPAKVYIPTVSRTSTAVNEKPFGTVTMSCSLLFEDKLERSG